ncbi:cysteine peptidase family C39 domain-containing protein [uncultured Nonlabens sp.]|uniref:peptidase domain-containing ABC transporter n=1 Tax=uncultured Nonlabens sp. TaxID=859306 RepID=UPI00261EB3B8|nr:cysteine peptidase family C39 domain-containing protein [uncultured Nonlabens sp.]
MFKTYSYKKHLVLQQDQKDCGCACLKMVLRYYSSDENLEYLKELSGTNEKGTSFLGLIQASEKLGIEAIAYNASIEDIIKLETPYILHIENDGMLHYVLCFGYNKKKGFIIADPGYGMAYYSTNQLEKLWKSGNILVFNKTERLVTKSVSKYEHFFWVMSMIKQDQSFYIAAVFIGVMISLLSMSTLVFTEKLIDVVLPSRDIGLLFKTLTIWFLLLITILILSFVRSKVLLNQAYRFNIRVFDFFFKRLLRMPKLFFDSKKKGDMIARMNDTQRIQRNVKTIIADSFIEFFTLVVALIFLFSYSTAVGWLVTASFPVLLLSVWLYIPTVKRLQQRMFSKYAVVESNYIDTISGINTIKVYNKEPIFFSKTVDYYKAFQKSILELVHKDISQALLVTISGTIITGVAIAYAVLQVYDRAIETGDLIAIISLVTMVVGGVEGIVQLNFEILESKIALQRMFDFVQRGTTLETEIQTDQNTSIDQIYSISINNVVFAYPGQSLIIEKSDLSFKKGQIHYLMGSSGSGKSTLAQLLLKFYNPVEGTIMINNDVNLKNIDNKKWLSYVSYVPQDIKIYNESLYYNLTLGLDIEIVIDYCENELGLASFFNKFKDDYNTILGEEGVTPSGGEKQFIAIARALIHRPKLLILDEATSSLDSLSQLKVLKLLDSIKKNMIILFITHDDRIVEKNNSTVYELRDKIISLNRSI